MPGENPLQDQEVRLRDWLRQNLHSAVEVDVMSIRQDRRSGNALLDPFLGKLRDGCDLVLLESLGDVGRGFDVHRFLGLVNGQNTRIVAIEDSFDSSAQNLSLAMMMIGIRYGFDQIVTSSVSAATTRALDLIATQSAPQRVLRGHEAVPNAVTAFVPAGLALSDSDERLVELGRA